MKVAWALARLNRCPGGASTATGVSGGDREALANTAFSMATDLAINAREYALGLTSSNSTWGCHRHRQQMDRLLQHESARPTKPDCTESAPGGYR